jgi:hypothetical protein
METLEQDEVQARNEDILLPAEQDARIVKTIVKMRGKVAQLTKECDAAVKVIKDQQAMLEAELLKRLLARGATQTKTDFGTAYIKESVQYTIADGDAYWNFVKASDSPDYYQARVKAEAVRAYQAANEDRLPPGLSSYRENGITVRTSAK